MNFCLGASNTCVVGLCREPRCIIVESRPAPGALIVIASTSFNQEEAEPLRVVSLAAGGTRVEVSRPLK